MRTDKIPKTNSKGPINTVSIVYVEVPDAEHRLLRAIELLLDCGILGEEKTNRKSKKQQGFKKGANNSL